VYKFQYKFTILSFLKCANLHMIEKPNTVYGKEGCYISPILKEISSSKFERSLKNKIYMIYPSFLYLFIMYACL
jgi:hypothetical protein